MTPRRLQIGLGSFGLLSAAVLFNAFYLQSSRLRPAHSDRQQAGALNILSAESTALEASANRSEGGGQVACGPDTIQAIQRELAQRGYGESAADGVANPATRAAIFAFEYDQGLRLTAEPSEDLLKALILGNGGATQPAGIGTSNPTPRAQELIHSVQKGLADLGLGPFKVAGQWDTDTSRAIARFEREHNLPQTGRISAPLVAQLARSSKSGHSSPMR